MHRILIEADGRESFLVMLKPRCDGFLKYRSLFKGSVNTADEVTVLLYEDRYFSMSPSAAGDCLYTFEGLLRSTTQRLTTALQVYCSQLLSLG